MGGFPLWILPVAASVVVRATGSTIVFSPSDMDLDVQSPPHVTAPNQPVTKYVTKGKSITIHCRATGNPTPELRWKRNGNLVSKKNDDRLKEGSGDGTLEISSFDFTLEGYYQCQAVSSLGVSLSHIVQIWQRVEPKFTNDAYPSRVLTVGEGKGVRLNCTDKPYSRPPGPFSWYHVIREKTNQEIPVYLLDRMDIDHEGNLYILSAQRNDTADTYACAVTSDDLHIVTIAMTPYVSLKVTPGNGLPTIPEVMGSTGQATVDIGKAITLECFFSGIPTPKVQWFLRNSKIDNGFENRVSLSPGGHKLTIKKVKDDDEGNYVCEATNSMGTASATSFLNVTSPPLFRNHSPQLIVAPVGSDATFTCLADGAIGEQSSVPVWTINGDQVSPNPRKFNVSSDGTRLTIYDVTKNDMMCLQCNVSNSRGYAFGDGYLIVIDPLVVVSRPKSTIEVDLEDTQDVVNLTVVAASDRCCPAEFSWAYNGKTLGKSALHAAPYSYQQSRNIAKLSVHLIQGPKSKTLVDGILGTFRCDVWNSAYADNTTVLVTLKLKEPEREEVEDGPNLWWIGLVGGIIVLLLAIVAIVLMIRYNYPRQAYLLEKEEKKHKLNPERDMLDHSFEEI